MSLHFKSSGKLLLTGEYAVLDGAKGLAVPTSYGQSLSVESIGERLIKWESLDLEGQTWFSANFSLSRTLEKHIGIIDTSDKKIATRLLQILKCMREMNPKIFDNDPGYIIKSQLDFPRDWGLGSSSTLISNLAQWSGIDPYQLLSKTFGGSGYDIACALSDSPLTYQLKNSNERVVTSVSFDPSFKNQLYFIHLNKKQNSREGITRYKSKGSVDRDALQQISAISEEMIACESLPKFQQLMKRHEDIISALIDLPPVNEKLFPDFSGQLKSLGAWGGDFIMAASEEDVSSYFKSKGYPTVISYEQMCL